MRKAPFPAFESSGRAGKSDDPEAAIPKGLSRLQKYRQGAADPGSVSQEPA
jgi:hypothetical protein